MSDRLDTWDQALSVHVPNGTLESPDTLQLLLEEIADAYVSAPSTLREHIRELITRHPRIRRSLPFVALEPLRRLRGDATARKHAGLCALALVSIHNGGPGYRDVFMTLMTIYLLLEDMGTNPIPLFTQVGTISSRTDPPGDDSVAALFDETVRRFEEEQSYINRNVARRALDIEEARKQLGI